MLQEWPVRQPRPYKKRLELTEPLVTGQRVIDTLFPVAKGGTAAIPGGFGTGKTMTQHQLAKWSNADIIVYVGCGERGNEITEVLEDFPKLIDPRTGQPLMNRTVLIANTSNMPVAAREASIYTGITLAEYYRDMGYDVALMADSTSRWAEALREISGRLEEMPAEEGFPAYLPSRLSEFYERAGMIENLNETKGSITIIGAVSPQGGDFSEPVTQNTKRFIRCFWALDKQLAYTRHYPAINWITSYSEYFEDCQNWYRQNANDTFIRKRAEIIRLLQEEGKLLEIVKLIGSDILPDEQKLVLETAKVIRQGFLQQNAYHENDTYVPVTKQLHMMETILELHEGSKKLVAQNIPVSVIRQTGIFEDVIRMKYTVDNESMSGFDQLQQKIHQTLEKIDSDYQTRERKGLE
jgi:V/A-type H+-transporting ATPase subunit A